MPELADVQEVASSSMEWRKSVLLDITSGLPVNRPESETAATP
jgi:hypothetical protein